MHSNKKEINSTPTSQEADLNPDSIFDEISQKIPQIRVVVKEPGKNPVTRMIENTLKAEQTLVGGYIETIELDEDITLICNENGKLLDLPFNFRLPHYYDYICGTTIFASSNDEGDFTSLSDAQVSYLAMSFREPSSNNSERSK